MNRPETMFRDVDVFHVELSAIERHHLLTIDGLDGEVYNEVRGCTTDELAVLTLDEVAHLATRAHEARDECLTELARDLRRLVIEHGVVA